jgi:hypothetical protein
MHEPELTVRVVIFVAAFLMLNSADFTYNRSCQERFGVEPLSARSCSGLC